MCLYSVLLFESLGRRVLVLLFRLNVGLARYAHPLAPKLLLLLLGDQLGSWSCIPWLWRSGVWKWMLFRDIFDGSYGECPADNSRRNWGLLRFLSIEGGISCIVSWIPPSFEVRDEASILVLLLLPICLSG